MTVRSGGRRGWAVGRTNAKQPEEAALVGEDLTAEVGLREVARSERIPGRDGNDEQRASQATREGRRRARSALQRSLHDERRLRESRERTVALRKSEERGVLRWLERGDDGPAG